MLVSVEFSLFLLDVRQPLLDVAQSLPRQGVRCCAVLAVYGNDLVASDFKPWISVVICVYSVFLSLLCCFLDRARKAGLDCLSGAFVAVSQLRAAARLSGAETRIDRLFPRA